MFRVSSLFLLLALISLAACDVQVHPPVVVEKRTVVVKEEPAPIEIHVDGK